ncbi:diphthamide biosynthesis enzyme (DPH1) [Vairimorpha necatrix]|uniref:2-(3-amino-3-carboxypropyl)histidine synthase subunit 1 n=1 Tax=Vairimorpha necatrix TaxID=6039 RepID=A0AAX4JBT1_9MICR
MVFLSPPDDNNLPNDSPYLPPNYNFEISKTLKTILKHKCKTVTLQFPDGLLRYSLPIIDLITQYTPATCIVLNDVVYGACCVDDTSLKSDLLVHYGHSCLVPVTDMCTRVLYVFVDIKIDITHLHKLIISNFRDTVSVVGTIQFNSSISRLARLSNINMPQIKPLSRSEVLGCTSPIIKNSKNVISIGDGRFHLESVMINNPTLSFYQYCPFSRKLTREFYDYDKMVKNREKNIKKARAGKIFGIILGTLGKQGNKTILKNVISKLKDYKLYVFQMEEITPNLLDRYEFIDSFVQISCPRLSTDWGESFKKPLLSSYEVFYELGSEYKLDYYSKEGYAPYKNYNNI